MRPSWPEKHWRITVPLGLLPERRKPRQLRLVIDLRVVAIVAVALIMAIVFKVLP